MILLAATWWVHRAIESARTSVVEPGEPADWSDALRGAEERLRRDADDASAIARAARAAVELADWPRAAAYLRRLPFGEPDLWWRTGEGLAVGRHYRAAAEFLEQFHAAEPHRLQAVRRLALVEWQLGRHAAVARLAGALEADPAFGAFAACLQGDVAHRGGDHAAACLHYATARKLDPDATRLPTPPALLELRFARSLAAVGRLTEAEDQARSAARRSPNPAAEFALGEVRRRLGDSEGAYWHWCTALELDRRYYPAAFALARLALDQSLRIEAAGWLELAAKHELEPDRPAQKLLDELLPESPSGRAEAQDPPPSPLLPAKTTLRDQFEQACSAAERGDWSRAADILEQLLEIIPDHALLLDRLHHARAQSG